MIRALFLIPGTPAPLGGMAFPTEETDWQALRREGFDLVVRLHEAEYDPSPLVAHDVALEDLYGGAAPGDAVAEERRVWQAARLVADGVSRGRGVIVHCFGGTGRTGTVLACALRLLGRTPDEAIAAVQVHRPEWPESPWQEQVVRSEPGLP